MGMAEVEVDADVFYDFFLSFGYKNQTWEPERCDRPFLPFRFIYCIAVNVFGPL
jgi:hypothetical protein